MSNFGKLCRSNDRQTESPLWMQMLAKFLNVLVIMDGVGHREAVEDNAYLAAKHQIGLR